MKNPPDVFFICLSFALANVLIFSGEFLHRLYRLLNFNLKWLRVTTAYFSRKTMKKQEGEPKIIQTQLEGKKETYQKPHQKQTLYLLQKFKLWYIPCTLLKIIILVTYFIWIWCVYIHSWSLCKFTYILGIRHVHLQDRAPRF